MTDLSSDTAEVLPDTSGKIGTSGNTHADKYNDPRAKITKRGILLVVAIFVLGIFGALGSIYARRTRLEKTTQFWGPETILALQLAERIDMKPLGDGTSVDDEPPVQLTGMPGLGHLRRALLDERNFLWPASFDSPMQEICDDENARCVQLRLTDPTAKRFDPVELHLDLNSGWIGPSMGSKRVRANERVQPALRHFLDTIVTFEQKSYDMR